MDLSEIDTSKNEFSDEELTALADVLTKAEEIKKDKALFNIVKKHIEGKTKAYKSVADLRKKANEG